MMHLRSALLQFICPLTFLSAPLMGAEPQDWTKSIKFKESVNLLETCIESMLDYDRLPGVSITVVHDQDIIYAKGFGYADVQKGVKTTPDTYYCIASISKQFTAIAIMQLRDQGKLSLDDPVAKYLDWFPQEFERSGESQITIADLLRHSSGLPTEPDHTIWPDPDELFPSRKEFIKRVQKLKLSYPVGTQLNYSNTGYALLGEIVSVVSDMDYDKYVQEYILDPLDLDHTTPDAYARSFRSKAATGYGRWPREGSRVEIPIRATKAMIPAEGFGSTAMDLAKFARWQFRVLDGRDTQILATETLKEMQSAQWEDPNYGTWGYGFQYWYLGDLDIWGHQGGAPGYQSQFMLCPEQKIAVAVMFNAYDAPKWTAAFNTYEIMAAAVSASNREEIEAETAGLERYTGYYTADLTWSEAEVVIWDGSLAVLWLPAGRPTDSLIQLRQVEGHVFRQVRGDESLGKHFVFGTDDNGNISRMKFNNNILMKADR